MEWEADWLMLVGYKHRKEEIHWVPLCAAGIDYTKGIRRCVCMCVKHVTHKIQNKMIVCEKKKISDLC